MTMMLNNLKAMMDQQKADLAKQEAEQMESLKVTMEKEMRAQFQQELKKEIADFKEKTLNEIKSNNNSPAKIRPKQEEPDFVPSFGALFQE